MLVSNPVHSILCAFILSTLASFFPAPASFAQTAPSWCARWISPGFPEDSVNRPCPIFNKTFSNTRPIKKATLYITAHGLYSASLNRQIIGNAVLTPGYTSYDTRLQYQSYDVTALLAQGRNSIEVTIGDGWWRGTFGGWMQQDNYGKDASLLLQLEITYRDGTRTTIGTDESWRSGTGPIRSSDLYAGETQDTRIRAGNWTGVRVGDYSKKSLIPQAAEPTTRQERFRPVKIFRTPKGEQIIDFGQNLAGWVRLRLKGKAADTIKLFHAESLDSAGNFYTGNLREARSTDEYILNGTRQTLEPHFTYHGFRYVRAEGFTPTKQNCVAIAIHSALRHTGHFACSNPLLNRLQHNIEWSLNSNFLDIPTDCPQRSERLGWTGDAQVFCRTAAFNRNINRFFSKWLVDLSAGQGANGAVPVIIPDIYGHGNKGDKRGVAGWGDAATIIPWTLYEVYDDKALLARQYSSMRAWVDYVINTSPDCLWKAKGYGDWYAQGPSTPIEYIDQCFFIWSAKLLIRAAGVLHCAADAAHYSVILQQAQTAFSKTYKSLPETQTAYTLALQFDLLPDSLQAAAAAKLAALIHQNNDHLATGFLGTPYLLFVLTRFGYTGLAYTILNQQTMPSWLYPLGKGATTIWEKWDAIRPDGSFDTCSLNHYSYGAVGDWLYRDVAGIDAAAPGYKKIIIRPHPGGGLSWVRASYQCPYGRIVSNWKISKDKLLLQIDIPPHTTAIVYLPGKHGVEIGPGHHEFTEHKS